MFVESGDEGDDAELEAPKIYEPITSFQQLSDRLSAFEGQYNELVRGSQMDLVFFKVGRQFNLFTISFA